MKAGGRVVFYCSSGDLRFRVQWSKKDGQMPANVEQSDQGRLLIYNLTLDDAGEYECTAPRGLPGSTASVFLEVVPRK